MYKQNEDMICGELHFFLRYEFIVRILYRCLGSNICRLPPRTVSLLFCCTCANDKSTKLDRERGVGVVGG